MNLLVSVVACFVVSVVQFSAADSGMLVVAGSGTDHYSGDNGPATSAELYSAYSVWGDSSGNAYVTSFDGSRVRYISGSTGIITTIMGTGTDGFDSGGGIGATFPLVGPWGITADRTEENLYVSDSYHIWKYNIATTVSTPFAGNEDFCSFSTCPSPSPGDGGPATSAHFGQLTGLYLAADGTMYVTDGGANNVRRIDAASPHIISLVSGNGNDGYGGDGGPAASAVVAFSFPSSVYVDTDDVIFIGDERNSLVRYIDANGIIDTYAGGGVGSTDGTAATSFDLGGIGGIAGDPYGNVYVTSYTHNQVYLIGNGIVFIILGSGNPGISLGLSGEFADLDKPSGLSLTFSGFEPAIYLSEIGSGLVKKVVNFDSPTSYPSSVPSAQPANPTAEPTGAPSVEPQPSGEPTVVPSSRPAANPTGAPSVIPSYKPAADPTSAPSAVPTSKPAADPTASQSGTPSVEPTVVPSSHPVADPTRAPSAAPSPKPAADPTGRPSVAPSSKPSTRPISRPSSAPSSVPSSPTFAPTKAPNVNDVVEIKGGFIVETVYDNFLNNRSMSTITAAVYNISGSAQEVKITTTKLLNKKGRLQGLADTTYRFKIDFLVVYYLSYYSGWNSSYVAEMKSRTMKEAVEEGTFTSVLQNLAEARNATQLLTVTCDAVTLLSTIISPDSASSSSSGDHKSRNLSGAAVAGIVVGSFMALVFLVLYLLARYLDEKNAGLPTKSLDTVV
jgi:hypothetical protein